MMANNVRRLARRPVPLLTGLLILLIFIGATFPQNSPDAPGAIQERRTAASASQQPFAVEYYYQVRWGYADEFIRLFRKNHYPVLKKQLESGRLLSVAAVAPRYHATEDRRWDYRVTIVFRNAQVASEPDPNLDAIVTQLYPDQETFRREEQRRFEILLAHWDVPTVAVDLTRQ
jgi:hypothetical protein